MDKCRCLSVSLSSSKVSGGLEIYCLLLWWDRLSRAGATQCISLWDKALAEILVLRHRQATNFGFTQKETSKREGIPTSSKFMVPSSKAAKGNSKPEPWNSSGRSSLQEIFLDDPSGCSYYPAASDFNGLGGLVKRQAVRQNRALANDCSRRTSNTTLEGASDQFFRGRVVFPGTMSRDRQLC